MLNFFQQVSYAKVSQADSLKAVVAKMNHDSTRCSVLYFLSQKGTTEEKTKFTDLLIRLSEFKLSEKGLSESEYKLYKKFSARATLAKAKALNQQNEREKALEYYVKSLTLFKELNDSASLASNLSNIGSLYNKMGNIEKGLEYQLSAFSVAEKINNKRLMGMCLIHAATMIDKQGDSEKALENYQKAFSLLVEAKDKFGMTYALNNIGGVYMERKQPDKALEYYNQCLKIREEIGDKNGMAQSLLNIGAIYYAKKDIEKALDYGNRSLKIREEINERSSIIINLTNIASLYLDQKKFEKALEYTTRSMELSKSSGSPENIKLSAGLLSEIYQKMGDDKKAFENYNLFLQMKDSISNESTRKTSIKQQIQYEYEKHAAADSVSHAREDGIKNAQLQKQQSEINAKKNQQYALFGGVSLILIFSVFMFNRYKHNQKQKKIIEFQKDELEAQKIIVEEKQKEILDSIYYARRIQLAHLPSEKIIIKNIERLKKI